MSAVARQWWRDAVTYQVYPRSFQDSDGDGIGDLRGVIERLDHLAWLGVDALWLSPIHPSPDADLGYDVSDYESVDPRLGTLDDFEQLVAAAHSRGIRVVLDLVASHTSIEHPWFREHPDWYLWSDHGPANNWRASFGGSAWARDERSGRWYLHSFFPEQPDLDWRNPEVREAIGEVVRVWRRRGVDGFRVDAADRLVKDAELRDDPPARRPFPLPLHDEHSRLDHLRSRNDPDIGVALGALAEAADGAPLIGEVYLPNEALRAYLEHLELVFSFEFMHSPWQPGALREAIAGAVALSGVAWVLSNHDFPRLATRVGEERTRIAALLLLTLPGAAFVYQGDEIGMSDGPGADPPLDRVGRDVHRHPMQWEPRADGGFTSGRPWLPLVDPELRNVGGQRDDRDSLLRLYRRLIELRRGLGGGFRLLDATGGVLAYARGEHVVAINLGDEPTPAPPAGELVLATEPGADAGEIAPNAGLVVRREAASDRGF
ncbi:MAG TPA: alpha-amylase family glycosyl hydrolase [Solirubrobacterales bacterium]|nr:alpha-amylase family glycosyl hydrolase [Solirubrobacterales bacterium]